MNNFFYSSLGDFIRTYRTYLGLTQEELANRSGVSRTHIVHIENGRRTPTLDVLVKLAEGMGLKLAINFEPNLGQPLRLGK